MPPETQTSLSIRLGRLPDFDAVGGNAKFLNPGHKYGVYQREKREWETALRAANAPQYDDGAFFNNPVELRATLHFPTASKPDYENAIFAMKILVDLFQPFTAKLRQTKNGPREYSKGMLGWLANDRLIVWPWLVTAETRSPHAPCTEISLHAVGHEQRSLL